jgi:hypothetical protein
MSDKYSTEELVGFLGNGKLFMEIETRPDDAGKPFQKVYVGLGEGIQDAIIARLRAADALCEMDKKMVVRVTGGTGITLGEMADWAKSIAKYEGKK